MKYVIIVRHAKSSWDNVLQKDFDRPLNVRGQKDAHAMAKRVKDKGINIDAFIASPAVRAYSTAAFFAKQYGKKEEDIITLPALYEPLAGAFSTVIKNTSEKFDTIALFSHNPGITEFVNTLTATRIDDMPTCAVFGVKAETNRWENFDAAKKTFWFFEQPKSEK